MLRSSSCGLPGASRRGNNASGLTRLCMLLRTRCLRRPEGAGAHEPFRGYFCFRASGGRSGAPKGQFQWDSDPRGCHCVFPAGRGSRGTRDRCRGCGSRTAGGARLALQRRRGGALHTIGRPQKTAGALPEARQDTESVRVLD